MALLDPYTGPWTSDEAAHLARRAGFGARPSELPSMVAAGMSDSVDALVDYDPLDAALEALIDSLPTEGDLGRVKNPDRDNYLQGWWLYRMVHTSQPLQEQFTLFLHDHFVLEWTKVAKGVSNRVNLGNDGTDPGQRCTGGTLPPDSARKRRTITRLLRDQNELLRTAGHGPFRQTLRSITRDPAMLIYLDNRTNKKNRPQENYAREIMELFSMGVNNYSEDDVREVARAFTGETINRACEDDYPYDYVFNSSIHDTGFKSVFAEPPFNFTSDGEDTNHVIDLLLDRVSNSGITPAHSVLPATSLYVAWKFITWFVDETIGIDHPAVPELADFFRSTVAMGDIYNVRETLRRLFKSQLFFDPAYRYNMYKHPADFAVMALRNLEIEESSYTGNARKALEQMGMRLFSPPNVAGWNHGKAWINSSNQISRFNYADRLSGSGRMTNAYVDDLITAGHLADQQDHAGMIEYFRARLIQAPLRPEETTALNDFLQGVETASGSANSRYRRKVRGLAHIVMSLPRYQLK